MTKEPNYIHRRIALVLTLAALAAPAAWAQGPSSTSISAGATLNIPLEIFSDQDLDFGELIKTATHTAGVVTAQFNSPGGALNPESAILISEPSKVVDPNSVDHQAGRISFSGDPTKQVVISSWSPAIVLEKAGATNPQEKMDLLLTVEAFVGGGATLLIESPPGTYQMPSSGLADFFLTGTLDIKFDNESGVYSATVPVSLNYL